MWQQEQETDIYRPKTKALPHGQLAALMKERKGFHDFEFSPTNRSSSAPPTQAFVSNVFFMFKNIRLNMKPLLKILV